MTNSKGYRRSTRKLFSRGHRQHGYIPLSKLLTVYKKGDLVSIRGNGAVQKGMPHKSYHGKTGRVFNVTKRAISVTINKRVRGRVIPKKICVRLEHVIKNKSRDEFIERVHRNEKLRREAKEKGVKVLLKRIPQQPRDAHVIRAIEPPVILAAVPYEFIA